MTPLDELQQWRREFLFFRRKVYILITVGFGLIIIGFGVIAASYLTGQDDIHRVGCANSQSLVTQYEFVKSLAMQNQSGTLTQAQIKERAVFYAQAEHLARERAGNSCASLPDMKAQAARDISAAFKRSNG